MRRQESGPLGQNLPAPYIASSLARIAVSSARFTGSLGAGAKILAATPELQKLSDRAVSGLETCFGIEALGLFQPRGRNNNIPDSARSPLR